MTVSATFVVTAAFVVLLALEWRYRHRGLRLAPALLALAALLYFQPSYTSARRRALGAAATGRVILDPVSGSHPDTLSEYDSGVYTTMRWIEYYVDEGARGRLAAIAALLWLTCSPAFRNSRGHGDSHRAPGADSLPNEA